MKEHVLSGTGDLLQKINTLKFVILFNPTLRTKVEYNFWEKFTRFLVTTGYVPIVYVSRLPAKPLRYAIYTGHIPFSFFSRAGQRLNHPAGQNAVEISEKLSAYLIDYEILRTNQNKRCRNQIYDGLIKCASYMESILSLTKPWLVIVNNDTMPQAYLFTALARSLNIRTIHSERSPSITQWFEPEGYYALSRLRPLLPEFLDAAELRLLAQAGGEVIDQLTLDPTAHRGLDPITRRGHGRGTAGAKSKHPAPLINSHMPRRILLPMDEVLSTGWTPDGHPLRKMNYPIFKSPRKAISTLSQIAGSLQAVLILKPHPNQVSSGFFNRESLPPNVELYHGPLKPILDLADVVVCFLTKVAFSALAMGKAVVTLAPNPAALSGLTFHCTRESEVNSSITAAFNYQWSGTQRKQLAQFLGYLENEYFVANDLSNNGAHRLLAEYFPPMAPPDPEAVQHAQLLLSSIDPEA